MWTLVIVMLATGGSKGFVSTGEYETPVTQVVYNISSEEECMKAGDALAKKYDEFHFSPKFHFTCAKSK